MFRVFCVVAFGLIAGCAPQSAQQSEEDIALLRESLPGINQKCIDKFRAEGVIAIPQDVRECFPMEERKRWSGLWLNEFEGSRFCSEPAEQCNFYTEGPRVWLTFAEEIGEDKRPDRYATDELYEIEFFGRQTSQSGAFGHMGSSDKEIVVEKLIRLERMSES
ncbi:MAG: hypothetical protein CL510_05060 [Actinobacteria bacterium]|nr:hypothetical protein [Actinomycetota bacterium]|tara:strand:- start:268 stop:756 length:489 start_codon:yes stop_codon:yes gene_type:complete